MPRHRAAGPGVAGWVPGLRGGVHCRAKPEAEGEQRTLRDQTTHRAQRQLHDQTAHTLLQRKLRGQTPH